MVTAAIGNTHWRDNLIYLKGTSEIPTIESGLVIDNTGGDEYFKLPLLSTAECNTVLAIEGKVAFDEATHTPKYYNGTAVKDIGDHGSLGGLTDDDHTIYQKESLLTTAGDLPYATGASAWERLGIGTAGQYLKTNADATAPEWGAPSIQIAASNYAGNNADNRQITTGFVPKLVIILGAARGQWTLVSATAGANYRHLDAAHHSVCAGTNFHATDGFVVSNTTDEANANGTTYNYVAIG